MRANKSVISGLLGIALLAMPITAAARPNKDGGRFNRQSAPAYHPERTFRAAPMPGIVQAHDHDGWRNFDRHERHDRDDWNRGRRFDRDDYRWAGPRFRDRDDYQWANRWNRDRDDYPNRGRYYRDSYEPDSYDSGYGAPYYAAPVGGGLGGLIRERDNAQILYGQAVRNGNRVRAKHLNNDIRDLNKRIARAQGNRGYGYSAFNAPYANSYDYNQGLYGYNQNSYGYGGGLESLIQPLLGGYSY
jgi:hypothetical protein